MLCCRDVTICQGEKVLWQNLTFFSTPWRTYWDLFAQRNRQNDVGTCAGGLAKADLGRHSD